jgi:hypothetical protein
MTAYGAPSKSGLEISGITGLRESHAQELDLSYDRGECGMGTRMRLFLQLGFCEVTQGNLLTS